jgi:ABC-2 type transport system ATP-binding protein
MDPEARAATRAIVTAEREAGAAILLTSHDLADVERLADRIVIIDAGRVVAAGTPDELRAGTTAGLRFRLDRPLEATAVTSLRAALAVGHSGLVVAPDGDDARYRLDGAAPDAALIAALATWCAAADRLIVELLTAGGSLEDVYLDLVATSRDATDQEVAP